MVFFRKHQSARHPYQDFDCLGSFKKHYLSNKIIHLLQLVINASVFINEAKTKSLPPCWVIRTENVHSRNIINKKGLSGPKLCKLGFIILQFLRRRVINDSKKPEFNGRGSLFEVERDRNVELTNHTSKILFINGKCVSMASLRSFKCFWEG